MSNYQPNWLKERAEQLVGTFFQPIMFLVLFSAVFGGAIAMALSEGVTYLNF